MSAEECRAVARECAQHAARLHDPTVKAIYLRLSRVWRELAAEAERTPRH
jgi:hypothetical protein